ncbi:iron-containing alcohol dehydrogenase [Brevibacillus centrosporus]|jgi:1,3-propanediol dehydrogenase|uniref:1,3-propanediol dehydrogenase n=1 Tax=Brevibacillus centrosporus TaxID=54910 RepID=A0A1I4E025_9BACL|nr:iron-containing alcohol dehydrogenase [Brevibacillus centrosporus]MEC2132044.1 iron-containing alcohol dehydrogenase [Brevibacillus centrosporus]MED1954243.1 iron-containing alcohol dehydrogenase [Brevibacillus centrosporus]MED4911494.1 iron-containing alcohol dehydrogenase [Brevibacillus centrosporus]RNB65822.1 iron-containing alcohol dehydrogenase [Brevibacillus centrosporus]SFK98603.1 1,3-propanediol dehydrogenase [Brevibacillus centrosporus]
MQISKFMTPEIIFGNQSIAQIGESLRRLGATRVFLVSDSGVVNAGWVERIMQILSQQKLAYHLWTNVTANPKDYEIHAGVAEYRALECDAILGVGGGSAIDAAKAIALLGTNDGSIVDYEGVDKITHPLPPMVMVPTTAGSGSEVSQFSIIVDSARKVKMAIISKSLIPDIAIIDPQTLMTKDRQLTANTGMDVLTHAIESYISLAATPLTEVHSLQAMRLIAKHLRPSVASQYNEEAKQAMAMASLQAGIAFSNAILGAVHAMSHQLGGFLDAPHGEVNAILLPHVLEYNFIAAPEKYRHIAECLGESTAGLSLPESSRLALKAVKELSRDLDCPESLSAIGLVPDQIELLSAHALLDVCMTTNPRDMNAQDVATLFRQAL